MEYYHRYQSTIKKRMQIDLERALQNSTYFANDDTISLDERKRCQRESLYYEEALCKLNIDTPQQKEPIFQK